MNTLQMVLFATQINVEKSIKGGSTNNAKEKELPDPKPTPEARAKKVKITKE